jgi:aconitate decarboxylase
MSNQVSEQEKSTAANGQDPSSTGPGPTQTVANFVAASRFDTLPDAVVDRTKYLVLDGLACGLVGAQLPWSRVAAEALIDLEGHGPATVWGWDQGTTPSTAALINGTFVQGFELDDYHEFGPLHSESIILPAAMATAQKIGGVAGTDLLVAAAMGFEFGPRLGIVMDGHDLIAQGWHCGVIYGSIAAALTTSRLRGLDAEGTSSAMGLAATQASGLMAAQFEAMVKRMNHAFAGRAGVVAGALAERGFTGIKDSLERDYGGLVPTFTHKPNSELDYGPLTRDLGQDWELMRILVKPYASGGTTHPGVDAMLHLRNDLGVSADDIESIKIRLPIHSFRHYGWKISRPTTNIGAQMNLCFVCALTLLDGKASIGQFTNARIAADDAWDLVDRISTEHDPEMDKIAVETKTPRATGFTVKLKDGTTHEFMQLSASGKGDLILTNEQIGAKYDELMSHVVTEDRAAAIKDAVLNLEKMTDVAELAALLAPVTRRVID